MKERQPSVLIAAAAPEDRAALRDALSRDPAARYVIGESESGLRALKLCRARKPDCLILDHDLPDLSGPDALEILAAEEGELACAVVVLVGAGAARLAVEAMKNGAYDCLEKDCARGEELRRAVRRAVERTDERRRNMAHERDLVEKIRAIEASLADLRLEASRRKQGEEVWHVARAGASARGGVVSAPKGAGQNRGEEQLRLLTAAIEQSHESVIVTTAQLDWPGPQIVYVNPAFTEMNGYSFEEVIGKSPRILYGPKTDIFVINQLRRDAAVGKVFHAEIITYRKDRSEFCSEWSAGPVRNERGEVTHFAALQRDVTERRKFDEALRESDLRFRQLSDAMPQIIYTCSSNGMIDCFNHQWYEYTGIPLERSVGDAWREVVHPDDRERAWRQWTESVKTGQAYEIEYRLRRKDGQYRWHLSRALPGRNADGRIIWWIGTATDIHDRKRAEVEREMLLDREQAARADAENTAECIRHLQMVTDSALAHLALDNLPIEMLGRIRDSLEADSAAILLLSEDEQSLVIRATIGMEEEALGMRIPVGRGVTGSIAADRVPLIVEDLSKVEVYNPVLRHKARSLIGAPLIVEDKLIGVIHAETIRTRRFTEEDVRLLQMAADRVALAIEQSRLYKVEQEARREAEKASRMKDEFLTLVSHELRSPLNAMLGYAAMLRQGKLDPQKVQKAADVIERSGKAQMQLIDDLLDTARIISGKLRLDVGPVDLAMVINESVQTICPAAIAKGISIQSELNSEVGQITGDPSRLRQVIWNLLSNAVKFTPPGGRIEVRLERIDPHVCITVRDTGKGISPDFLPYVFDRFRQADVASARRYGGLGLGLALVEYLVELHGGTIEAASAGEGQGATFRVTLPVRAVATPLGEAREAPVTAKCSGELTGVRALVVDDEDDARELLKLTLTQYGADVVAASSATEAYELITTAQTGDRPDVIVTDLGMPGEDGYSLIRRVREWERERECSDYLPAVALTAYGRTEDRMRALGAGFQMHVAKPVEPTELAVVITSVICRPNGGEN